MDAAINAAWLAVALLWRAVVGRVLRRTVERVIGAPSRFEHPLLDLLVGLLAGWLAFAVWSAVLKRAGGVGAPRAAFAIVELIVIAALAGWHYARTPSRAAALTPRLSTTIRLATFAALIAGLANASVLSFRSDNLDQDQHVAYALEIAHQGVVPDHYEGTDVAIDYPLGLHALAVATASALVSPQIVLNVLPLVTTLLVVGLACSAAAALALDGSRPGDVAPPIDLVLLESGCTVAFSLALFSGHFSVWPRYLVNGRQVAGLCQLVPVLACLAALLPPAPAIAAAPAWRRSAILVAILMGGGALAAMLNPVLVPLQAILSGVALLTAAIRRQVSWIGLAAGVGAGSVLCLAVIASDPYLGRRANVPGLRPPAAPYLAAVQADFLRSFGGRSCLTLPCVGRAIVAPAAFAVAREPLAAVTAGAFELLSAPPAPLRYDLPTANRHRFPDLTGVGLAPVHGRVAPYVFALAPWAFLAAVAATRHRRLAAAAAVVALTIALDAGVRGVLRAVIDPADAGLRLLPYYADTTAAVLFTQLLWPLLFVGALFAGARTDTTRWRWLRLAAAAAVLVPLAVSAAAPVAAGMRWSRVLDAPTRADLAALDRLERRVVPESDAFLVASKAAPPGGERWIAPTDDALLFYLHVRRPTLFLYYLDHSARSGPAGLEATCGALEAGGGDSPLSRTGARWALAAGSPGEAVAAVGHRLFCGRRLNEWFPAMRLAGSDGRLTIVELWSDPR